MPFVMCDTPSDAELARLRDKYECRVAQAEALSLLTDSQTDGETSSLGGRADRDPES